MADHRTLEAWKEARLVVVALLSVSRTNWQPWAGALFAQVQRSSLSVQLNIAEGWAYGRTKSCTRHLGIAYGSAVETADLIELLVDVEILSPTAGTELKSHSARCQALLIGLLKCRRPMS